MYNPSGSDDGREWIEIYNNGTAEISLEGWKFLENNIYHDLNPYNGNFSFYPKEFAVIVDNREFFLEDYPEYNQTLFDSSWTSLSNSGENISIVDDNLTIIDSVFYNTTLADGNGKSLERFSYGWNESSSIGGSPGKPNNDTIIIVDPIINLKGMKIDINLEEILYLGITYNSLFKITNQDHVSGITDSINVTIGYNITRKNQSIKSEIITITGINSYKTSGTGSFTPDQAGNYTISGWIINSTVNDTNYEDDVIKSNFTVIDTTNIPCNISLNLSIHNFTLVEGESIKFYNNLNNETYPYIIEYWIEDFFGNIYKNKYNTSNTNQKSWKTNIVEEDRVLFIKSKLYLFCNDSDPNDNQAESMFIVKGSESGSTKKTESSIEITDFDDDVKFGEIIDVDVEIYKADTSKYSISLWVEDDGEKISKSSKIHLKEKFSSFTGQVPIILKDNCNRKYDEGKYELVVEGLGEKVEEKINILDQTSCPKKTSETKTEKKSNKKFEYELLAYPEYVIDNDIESKIFLVNNDDEDYDIKIWSYVYRGKKCYSGDRKENLQNIKLSKDETTVVELKNTVKDIEPGDYKLKVLINKNNQKTDKQIIREIEVMDFEKVEDVITLSKNNQEQNTNIPIKEKASSNNPETTLSLSDIIIFESMNMKINNNIVYMIFFLLITLIAFLLIKKEMALT